jgi:hypothetical protein
MQILYLIFDKQNDYNYWSMLVVAIFTAIANGSFGNSK